MYIIPGNCDRSKSVKYLAKLQEQRLINILNLSGTYINNIKKGYEKVKPILTLHGHIHEAPSMSNQWWEKIGETISVNPGSSDRLNVVSVEIDDYGKVISLHHNIYGELKR